MKQELISHDDKVWRNGLLFRVRFIDDDDNEAPWDNDCGVGIVSDWTYRQKKPGERVLSDPDGRYRSRRFYDWAGTMRKAKDESWGLGPETRAQLALDLGHAPTPGQIRERAVQLDFDRLRRWCNDEWRYVGVVVHLLEDEDDDPEDDFFHALWHVESDSPEYLTEVAEELMLTISDEIYKAAVAAQTEADEARYWAERDVVTK